MEEETIFIEYKVTCETIECGNGMIPIIVQAPAEGPYFICGVCNQQITNYKTIEESTEVI